MSDLGAQKWPLCMSEARKIVEELKLEYYSDPKHLTFVEALYLLRTKAKLGPGLPSKVFSPWLISDEHPETDKINRLLHLSLQVQMGYIENTEFSKFILSNACLAVAGLLHVYLKNLGIDSTLIVSGVFCFNTKPNSDGTPHVWLEIGGRPIENTFVFVESGDPNLFFKMKSEELYSKEDLSSSTRKLFFGKENSPHSPKVFDRFGQNERVEQFLVSSMKICSINPSVKMFDIIMRDHIRRDFGVVMEDLEQKWDNQCWKCRLKESSQKLKICSACKIAKYCGPHCQKSDWSSHKILHNEIYHFAAPINSN